MNALEFHLLTTIADTADTERDAFDHCQTTLSMLRARGLIAVDEGDQQVFRITDLGLDELRRELRHS